MPILIKEIVLWIPFLSINADHNTVYISIETKEFIIKAGIHYSTQDTPEAEEEEEEEEEKKEEEKKEEEKKEGEEEKKEEEKKEGEEKKEFYSSAISVYTMVSIVGFMILSAVVLR